MRSLRSKILALAALLVVLTQFSTISTVLLTGDREVSKRADQILHKAASIAEDLSAGRHTRLRTAGAVLAADPQFRGTVSAGDPAALNGLLQAHRYRAEIDLLVLLDADGRILAGAAEGSTQNFPELVSLAMTGSGTGPYQAS